MTRTQTVKAILPLVFIATVLSILEPRSMKWGYDFKKGAQWKYESLVSQYDFPILKTDEQLAAERAADTAGVVPYYRFSADAGYKAISKLRTMELEDSIMNAATDFIQSVYEHGIAPDELLAPQIYIHKDKRAKLVPIDEIYTVSSASAVLAEQFDNTAGLEELLAPNLVYDPQTTELVHRQSERSISPTMGYVRAGEVIVSQGEVITPEIAQILDSYKAEYAQSAGYSGSRIWIWVGNILISIAIVAILFICFAFNGHKLTIVYNKYLYILTLFLLFGVLTLVLIGIDENFLFMCPFTLAALFLYPFLKKRFIMPVYAITLLPLLIFPQSGVVLFVMYFSAGVVTLLTFKRFNKGVAQFVNALITFAVLALIFLALSFIGVTNLGIMRVLVLTFIGSMLTVAGFPLVFLFERIFNLVSSMRLQELTDTSNELLRSLEQKAPGTFQHSLQVMNLASAAARAIDADDVLIRAGAMYHDIGKMENPLCFVENESLATRADNAKYHSELPPLQSAQDIIGHVTSGIELAEEHHLPDLIIDFIATHHGDSCVAYFYDKFIKEGGDESRRGEFCYKGRKPTSREQVILMLSDSIEAASRTLPDYGPKTISDLVENICNGKMAQGQFDEAEITLGEINTIKEVFKSYLAQIYHERIKYPKRNR